MTGSSEPQIVDTIPKRCPFVLLALKKALKLADVGQLLAVRTLDPQAIADIQAYCGAARQTFEGVVTAASEHVIYVRRSDANV
jgi:TusA-related sulfurtransferase